jgi:1-acyl-sn-glycerol-3-phosphate acyltransferase
MDPDERKVGRWSWKYQIVKILARIAFYLFYRRIYVTGRENVPDGGRLIFAANHQNALMDALAVIFTSKYQPVYLARADLFRNPLIARILLFLKIMPVYRFRDGVDSMGRNEDTFEKTSAILSEGGCIGIMPEGNHGDEKRLRVLKKGVFRIAFKAAETYDGSPDVKIVPVGLDYGNTTRVFEELVVNYGKPLPVSEYLELYNLHPQKGINAMRKDLSESMQSLMIDVRDESNYGKNKLLLDIGCPHLIKQLSGRSSRTINRFEVCRAFARSMHEYFEKNPGQADQTRLKSATLSEMLDKYEISPGSIEKPGAYKNLLSVARRVLCFPLYIAGYFLHIIPYILIHMALKKLKDPQFISSFKFGIGLLVIPLNYILLAVLFFCYLPAVIAALILAAVPVTGFIACRCNSHLQDFKNIMRFRRICRYDKDFGGTVYRLRSAIIKDLAPVFSLSEDKLK